MVRRLSVIALLFLVACAKEESEPESVAAPGNRVAWCGEAGEWRVVLEALAPIHLAADTRQSEESMLREQLPLSHAEVLLRLHLLGPVDQLSELGSVELGGEVFESFGTADESWSPRERLLWNGVLRGLPVPESSELPARRTALVHGDTEPWEAERGAWSRGQERIVLERRDWTENQRRAYFDEARVTSIDE